MDNEEPVIPARRRRAKDHLRTAAQSSVGSCVENYSVQAAIAEGLLELADAIRIQNTLLVEIAAKAIERSEGQL